MNFLSSVITYIRRMIKSPSNAQITDELIVDYINRFWIMDVDARIQLFDLKTDYQFQTVPGVDQYNMPLFDTQTEAGSQQIAMFPVYQGFESPAFINGIQVPINTQQTSFYNIWPDIVQQLPNVNQGDGTTGPYNIQFPIVSNINVSNFPPLNGILRGHVDIAGITATGVNQDPPFGTTLNKLIPSTSIDSKVWFTTQDQYGNQMVVADSGQFLIDGSGNKQPNYGLLMMPGNAPFGYTAFSSYSTTLNTVNYLTGVANVTFPSAVPQGVPIGAQCFFFQSGLPRGILNYNNSIILRSPPDQQYLVKLTGYKTPTAFMTTSDIVPFAYMAEYIARGAARKILADTGDWEQFQFYEPLFREQEILVWKRSQRQFTASRTSTIYSQGINQGQSGFNNLGGSVLAILWGLFLGVDALFGGGFLINLL